MVEVIVAVVFVSVVICGCACFGGGLEFYLLKVVASMQCLFKVYFGVLF